MNLLRKIFLKKRLDNYKILQKLFVQNTSSDLFTTQLKSLFKILSFLSNGEPSDHFEIDLKSKSIHRL